MQNGPRRGGPLASSNHLSALALLIAALFISPALHAQDWFHLETSTGASKLRLAVANFKSASADPATLPAKAAFDQTLYNDLSNAGIFDLVSKDMTPQSTPGGQSEIQLSQWSAAPANAAMVVFGNLAVNGGRLTVNGF